MASTPEVSLSPANSYSSQEWEQKRQIVTQLYRDEARSLYAVRLALARQGFRPTQGMLKKRIKKWALDRNKKEADMLYALGIAFDREKQGKKTVFLIRGRTFSFQDVKRYFHRKGVNDLKARLTEVGSPVPTTDIRCQTPQPDALLGPSTQNEGLGSPMSSFQPPFTNGDGGDLSSNSLVLAFPDPNQVDKMLSPSTFLIQLDQLLHFSRDYYTAIFETPDWQIQKRTFERGPVKNFFFWMTAGLICLGVSEIAKAFERFNRGFDLVEQILGQRQLLFLPYLYSFMMTRRYYRWNEVLLKLLEHTSKIIRKCYPRLRLVEDSMVILHQMSDKKREESSRQVFRSIMDYVMIRSGGVRSDKGFLIRWPNDVCSSPLVISSPMEFLFFVGRM